MIDPDQEQRDRSHLNLLSIFHFILAGLLLLGIGCLMLHYALMHAAFSDPSLWKAQKPPPPFDPAQFMKVFVWFYIIMAAALVAGGVLNLLSGLFLRQRKHWVFSLIIAALDCLQIPFGTVLGIFTIIVLLRDSVKDAYNRVTDRPTD